MPCKQQLSDLFLGVVSQRKTRDSFNISYKKNPLACGYVQSLHGGKEQTALQWDTDSAEDTAEASESIPALLHSRNRRGQGSFRWEHLNSASPVQEGNTVASAESNHPGSSSKSCTQTGHP